MSNVVLPVVLAGGFGTRLWPLSTDNKPKQFLRLYSENSLFQETIKRTKMIDNIFPPLIVASSKHKKILSKQLEEICIKNVTILLEPLGRNTAPAIALAALHAIEAYHDPIMLVLPSDHYIANNKIFAETINRAAFHAAEGMLVTFGITPDKPETGYGYIKRGVAINNNAFKVDKFVEKPRLEIAKNYIKSGDYYWNSGMFMFKAYKFLEELNKFETDIVRNCKKTFKSLTRNNLFFEFAKKDFEQCNKISIDYALMERTDKASVIPINVNWSDLGSWKAIWEISDKNKNGNVIKGSKLKINNVYNSLIISDQELIIENLSDIVLINTTDGFKISRLQ